MRKTNIRWYTPQEKKPTQSYVLAVFLSEYNNTVSSMTTLNVYNGHFNCYSQDLTRELFPDYWAKIPNLANKKEDEK